MSFNNNSSPFNPVFGSSVTPGTAGIAHISSVATSQGVIPGTIGHQLGSTTYVGPSMTNGQWNPGYTINGSLLYHWK